PMWLFQIRGSTADPIWFTEGTGGLKILDQEVNGYRQIEVGGATAGHGSKSIWTWDGKKYKETFMQVWGVNDKKGCQETETYRLHNGKLSKVSTSCSKG